MQNDDYALAAAQAAQRFLGRYTGQGDEILAACLTRLFAALQNGHSFIYLNPEESAHLDSLDNIVGQHGMPLILEGNRLFLGRVWQLEHDLAQEILRVAGAPLAEPDWMLTAQNLTDWFKGEGSIGQRDAAALALLQALMAVTGGPGTGKTTTVAKLLALICNNSSTLPRIALAAPTGKAAAHMARALHRAVGGFKEGELSERVRAHLKTLEGKTVHRLLKLRPPQMKAVFDKQHPLPFDVLVVDEASMLDTALMLQLLRAVPTGARLIFLGDENQLPSVGMGAVLSVLSQKTVLDGKTDERLRVYLPEHRFDTAEQPPVLAQNTAHLSFSHRFGNDSGIGCLSRAVVAGEGERAWAVFDEFPAELEHTECRLKQQVERLYRQRAAYWDAVGRGDIVGAFAGLGDIVVLAAWRSDAEAFNEAYREHIFRERNIAADTPYFAGQIVMIRKNDYAFDLFNGDVGLVMEDVERPGSLAAYFVQTDGFKKIAVSCLPDWEPAFAMTVHKSQGSEYREVWLLPPTLPEPADGEDALSGLSKELLYTAITRAREKFVFWGGKETLIRAIETVKVRRTALGGMLNRLAKPL